MLIDKPMSQRKPQLDEDRQAIAARVRELRNSRGLTQADLARQLGLSQNRLSEIERGGGSFSAEQFLRILRLFNVGASEFVSGERDRGLEVQNALARLGAAQLHESTHVLLSDELQQVHDVVREALVLGEPRLVTAVAPVLVAHGGRLNLSRLHADLEKLGRERRLAWIVENTLRALEVLAGDAKGTVWSKLRRRVEVPLELYLDFVGAQHHGLPAGPPDLLDATIRSRRTLEEVQRHASPPSERWGIATSLQLGDFVEALKASHVVR
jgi:transcriptional regulator with XRE-family HTH domain